MAGKTESYVDTAGFIAALDRSDSYHPLFRRLFSDPPRLITSALVIAEGHGWFLRRYDQRRAVQFLAFIDALSILTIDAFGGAELVHAGGLIRKFSDQNLTLADAHGLIIMKKRRIASCWSTDRHMSLTGVRLVVENS
jgi:predicted nucleic acid-binding protein